MGRQASARPAGVARRRGFARPAFQAGLLLWLPVLMGLGIGLWLALPYEPGLRDGLWLALPGLAAGLLWLRLPARWQRFSDLILAFALAVAMIGAGFALAGWRAARMAAPVLEWRYYGPVEGRVAGIDRAATDKIRLLLDQVVLRDLDPARSPHLVRVSLPHGVQALPPPGQRVMLTANLGPPPGPSEPGGFDFRRYAWFQGLGAIGYTRGPVLTVAPAPDWSAAVLDRWRMTAAAHIRDSIGGQSGAVVAALFTGDRSGIVEVTNQIMRAANLYHIVSISGLHMAMVAGFTYQGLRWVLVAAGLALRRGGYVPPRRLAAHHGAAIGALIAAAGYLWLSGGGVATERAFVMVAVMLGAIIAGRRAISLRSVALAAVLILALAPETLISAGFQMSFAATIALITVARVWPALRHRLPALLRPLAMLVLTSLVAGLATAPFAAAHFGRVPHYGLLANLLAVPVMGSVVMPAGVIAALLAPLGMAAPALWVAGLGTRWMLAVAGFVAGLDGATSMVRTPPAWVVPVLALGVLLPLLLTMGRADRALRRAAFAGAAMAVICALLGWAGHDRPHVLISGTGDAVAMLGADGLRVPSKSKGGGYAVARWLEGDGDAADQAQAAVRPGWHGPRHQRTARLGPDLRLIHLTGVRANALAAALCQPGVVLVSDKVLPLTAPPCHLLDVRALRATGAVALRADPDRPGQVRISTARDRSGQRRWTLRGGG